jgi:hypothetical protein
MVDCDGNESVRCERRAEPGESGRYAAGTVRQDNKRTPGPRRGHRIARGTAGAEEWHDRGADPLRLLARVGIGRVPDHRAECMCLDAAPIIRLGRKKISRRDADLEDVVGARDIYHCEKDQRQRQKPRPRCSR